MNISKSRVSYLALAVGASLAVAAFTAPSNAGAPHAAIELGTAFYKDADLSRQVEQITEQIGTITQEITKSRQDLDEQHKALKQKMETEGAVTTELQAEVKKMGDEYAKGMQNLQTLTDAVDALKKQLDAPVFQGKDARDANVDHSIELQRRAWIHKNGRVEEFVPDPDNIIDPVAYKSAVTKLVLRSGLETKASVIRSFNDAEKKAFEAASLDAALFSPEMLGFELNCHTLCNAITDLYDTVTVSRSQFMYPVVKDYGQVGMYTCDAKCDAEYGEEGNISFQSGKTYDFRGIFCFNKKVLQEANYDLLSFMMTTVARSYTLARNNALMTGDGINEPLGWMTADCFPKLKTAGRNIDHVEWRRFLSAVPTKYGEVVTTMHPNFFGYLASAVDANGRFIYGDGLMSYTPNDVRERIRISDCLPDPTENNTLGSEDNPFAAGSFLAAAGNWNTAYANVNKRPLWMEMWEGGSTAWCSKYVFGAEDGGFTKCCDAVRILTTGA